MSKLLISWCPGPESNRYVPFGTQDFKSYFAFFRNLVKSPISLICSGFTAILSVGSRLRKTVDLGVSVSQMSANFSGVCFCPDCIQTIIGN